MPCSATDRRTAELGHRPPAASHRSGRLDGPGLQPPGANTRGEGILCVIYPDFPSILTDFFRGKIQPPPQTFINVCVVGKRFVGNRWNTMISSASSRPQTRGLQPPGSTSSVSCPLPGDRKLWPLASLHGLRQASETRGRGLAAADRK